MPRFDGNWFFRDVFTGSETADDIYGHGGDDSLNGAGGRDRIYGGGGKDTLRGGTEDDVLFGEDGDDQMFGGGDDDELDGGNGKDRLNGEDGNDTLFGGNDADTLSGGIGHDKLNGGAGADRLLGDGDDDTLRDFWGNNTLDGGTGTDTADYSGYGGRIILTLRDGTAAATATRELATAVVGTNEPRFDREGSDRLISIENVDGGLHGDRITGNSASNVLRGHGGDDTLKGGGNDDHLFGGANDDLLFGEQGRDTLFGGEGNDHLIGGEGADELIGNAGQDLFRFFNASDASTAVTLVDGTRIADHIVDLNDREGDRIMLQDVDAIAFNGAVNDTFRFAENFTGSAGELLVRRDDDFHFRLVGDTNGDGFGDFFIDVTTVFAMTINEVRDSIIE